MTHAVTLRWKQHKKNPPRLFAQTVWEWFDRVRQSNPTHVRSPAIRRDKWRCEVRLRERFERWILGVIEWVMSTARSDQDIGLDDYKDLERQANDLRSRIKSQQSGDRG